MDEGWEKGVVFSLRRALIFPLTGVEIGSISLIVVFPTIAK